MGDEFRWRLADDDGGQLALFGDEQPAPGRRELPTVEYLHVRARQVISRVPPAANLPFAHTINVYRGCAHACTYCFARPTHGYLGLDGWREFETRIVVKINVAERLRAELAAPSWRGEPIAMGTNTDPYQPAEGRYRLTRRVIEVLAEAGNPFSILTKSPMILRDIDLLQRAVARGVDVRVALSVATVDREVWRLTEPGTASPQRRLDAVTRLNRAGIRCGVMLAPILPGLSDDDERLDAAVEGAVRAGATSITPIHLHLRPGVRELFMPWLAETRPDLVPLYERIYSAPSGNASRGAQQALADRVARLVDRHRGSWLPPRSGFRHDEGAAAPPAAARLPIGGR